MHCYINNPSFPRLSTASALPSNLFHGAFRASASPHHTLSTMAPFKAAPETARTQSAMSSSVRGRISGPIPMDNEFLPRKPGPVVAFEGGDSRQIRSSTVGSTNVTGNAPSDAIYEEENTDPPAQSGPSQASNASGSPQNRRTMRASTVRYSMVSNDSVPSRRPQRKKSTLKYTLGRIFGRKKKSTSELSGIDVPIPEPPSPTHHHSHSVSYGHHSFTRASRSRA